MFLLLAVISFIGPTSSIVVAIVLTWDMSCVTNASRRIRVLPGVGPALSINRWQIRTKNDVFPIPPSFKLSKAARAGRQPQKPRPKPGPALSINRWQIRTKNDVFPIPPSSKLSKSARAGRQPQKPRPKPRPATRSPGPEPVAARTRVEAQHFSRLFPNKPDASAFQDASTTEASSASTEPSSVRRNAIEASVNKDAPRVHGLYSGEIAQQHFQTMHPDLKDFMPAFVGFDSFRSDSLRMFFDAFDDLLPADPMNPEGIVSPAGRLRRVAYQRVPPTNNHQPSKNEVNRLPLHGHLITSNHHPINPEKLLPDGTDTRFLPGPAAVWQYRLWAGGSISVNSYLHQSYDAALGTRMIERPIGMRIIGKDRPERVFVKIRKSFLPFGPNTFTPVEKVLEDLGSRPTYKPDKRTSNTAQVLAAGPLFEEEYELCFLRDPPNLSNLSTKVVRPLENPKFTHELTPNRHLLFCWSAITYNAHLIHLDPTFARKEYGATDLVVHGPLTLFLVLEWFERQLTTYAKNHGLRTFRIRSINYKNLLPLYVDQEMTFCMKPSELPTPGQLSPKWDVWIEKQLEDDVRTMAFKGEILVQSDAAAAQEKPRTRRGFLATMKDDYAILEGRASDARPTRDADETGSEQLEEKRPKQGKAEEEAITFESPFFP